MGPLISGTADVDRIAEHVEDAYNTGISRGGEIATVTEARLGPSVVAMKNTRTLRDASRAAEDAAWILVEAEDKPSDLTIGTTRDVMWGALGRPKQSPSMDEVFPGGIGTYTDGDPRGQPLLMQVLHARILSASAPQWSAAQKAAWAAEIEARRVPYAAAVEALRPVEAAATVADAVFRATVRGAATRLRAYKRDLQNLGLTEAQIHEIIPDAGAGRRKKDDKNEGGGGAGGGEGSAPK